MAKKKNAKLVIATINPVEFLEARPALKLSLNSLTKDFSAQVKRLIESEGIQAHIKVSFGFVKESPTTEELGK